MLWQRAAIISVLRLTATVWNEGKAEREKKSEFSSSVIRTVIILRHLLKSGYLPENAIKKLIKLSPG